MEIVLARSVTMLIISAATVAYQGHDPRGNRRLLLVLRGACGTAVRTPLGRTRPEACARTRDACPLCPAENHCDCDHPANFQQAAACRRITSQVKNLGRFFWSAIMQCIEGRAPAVLQSCSP